MMTITRKRFSFLSFLWAILHFRRLVGADRGLLCKDHPAGAEVSNPVLIRSWEYLDLTTAVQVNGRVEYHPRFTDFSYRSVNDGIPATKYDGLDLFVMGGAMSGSRANAARIDFQRPAVVYMFVNAFGYNKYAPQIGRLEGWRSEGWVKLSGNDRGYKYSYGIHQKSKITLSRYAYVFSRPSSGTSFSLVVPHSRWLRSKVRGVRVRGTFHLRIGERDGKPSRPPSKFRGITIRPNTRCPDVLHTSWGTYDDNPNDRYTKGKWFNSWHPQWDPCFWCAYDHEHGSAAPYLMGYKPKYGYTETKNTGGVESDPGFKDFVFRYGNLMVYISIHAQTSSLRRVHTQRHTVTIVMKHGRTGELLAEVTSKGDFGFQSARRAGNDNNFVPLTNEGHRMKREQSTKKPYLRHFRSINVINRNNPDPRFRYSYPMSMGTYEEWVVVPPCTTTVKGGELTLDIQDPITGITSVAEMKPVWLGRRTRTDGFVRSTGLKRTLQTRYLTLSASRCGFGSNFKGGYFYSDAYFKTLRDGPGPNSLRQYIKPGFEGKIYGLWRPKGRWLGLHAPRVKSFFADTGYGIDPAVN